MALHDHIGRETFSEEAVERLIDALVRGQVEAEDHPLVNAATAVHSLASEPLPATTRARHLAAIHGSLLPLPTRAPRLPLRARFAAWATGLTAAATLASGATVAVADSAGPGDRLYGIDRAVERITLALQTDPAADARLKLRFAQERVAELDDTSKQSDRQSDRLVAEAVREARDAAEAADADAAAQAVATLIALLRDGVPEEARVPIARACLQIAARHAVNADVTVCRLAIATAPERFDGAPPPRGKPSTVRTEPPRPRRGPAQPPVKEEKTADEDPRQDRDKQQPPRKPQGGERDGGRPATAGDRQDDDRSDADENDADLQDRIGGRDDARRGPAEARRARATATPTRRGR